MSGCGMSEKPETTEDIIAEMRGIRVREFQDYADRLDAAHKREVDALKQRCAELDAEVAAKDEVIKRLNDAIAEDQKRSGLHGNMAKLRAVVEDLLYMAKRFAAKTPATETVIFDSKTHETLKTINYHKTIEKADAALAAPPRNCDVGTVEEQYSRMYRTCYDWMCRDCKTSNKDFRKCALSWAQMPYEEGEIK